MCGRVRKQLRVRENLLPGQLPVTLLHASHATSQLLSEELWQKWAHSCCFSCCNKSKYPSTFTNLPPSGEEGRKVSGGFIQLKEVTCNYLYLYVQQSSLVLLVCVHACVCAPRTLLQVHENICKSEGRITIMLLQDRVGLPGWRNLGRRRGGQRQEVWQQLRGRNTDGWSDTEEEGNLTPFKLQMQEKEWKGSGGGLFRPHCHKSLIIL